MWSCPYCPTRKSSHRFDDLRSHVQAVHWHGQPLYPPKATLERLDWWEEKEERRRQPDDNKERTWMRWVEKRTCSHQEVTPPRKVVRKDSPAAPSLGSLGESPGVLLSSLPSTPKTGPKKKSSQGKKVKSLRKPKPLATVSPEETLGPSQEEPAQVPPKQVTPDLVPGPSLPDTSIPVEDTQEDLPSQAVTFQDVRQG